MNPDAFVSLLVAGAWAIALWVEFRFPGFAPVGVRRTSVHLFAGILTLLVVMPLGVQAVAAGGSDLAALLAIFGVALPALVYGLLVSVWVIKFAQRSLRGELR